MSVIVNPKKDVKNDYFIDKYTFDLNGISFKFYQKWDSFLT